MDGGGDVGDEGDEGVGSQDGFTFDTNIASMHTYLGGSLLPLPLDFNWPLSNVMTQFCTNGSHFSNFSEVVRLSESHAL